VLDVVLLGCGPDEVATEVSGVGVFGVIEPREVLITAHTSNASNTTAAAPAAMTTCRWSCHWGSSSSGVTAEC
jgi:hypothetical protein